MSGFILTKEGYVCDCGPHTFTVVIEPNRFYKLHGKVKLKLCKTEIDEDNGTIYHFYCLSFDNGITSYIGSKSNKKQQRLFKKELIVKFNQQIALQIDALYLPGGKEFLKAQENISTLLTQN